MSILIYIKADYSYNILALQYFNLPSEIELPIFADSFQRKCVWISILNVLLPGLFIGYCYRFDKNKGGLIYTVT